MVESHIGVRQVGKNPESTEVISPLYSFYGFYTFVSRIKDLSPSSPITGAVCLGDKRRKFVLGGWSVTHYHSGFGPQTAAVGTPVNRFPSVDGLRLSTRVWSDLSRWTPSDSERPV